MYSNNFRESLRSPERSPKKSRPSTAYNKKLNNSVMVGAQYSNIQANRMNIMRELNGTDIES